MYTYYKLLIAYDGTDYAGWQQQEHEVTITDTLKEYFFDVFKQSCMIVGASRTDAGVHAYGQVARLKTTLDLDFATIQRALNNVLPPSIMLRSLERTDESFHPHKGVAQKTYYYHFFLEHPLPFVARFGWHYRYPVDIEKLKMALHVFVGKHDFRSFCTGYDMYGGTVREINSIDIIFWPEVGAYRIIFKGQSFLRHMIRRIVGASLEVASRSYLTIDTLKNALEEKDPEQTLPTAPGKGLVLYEITYE